jgi:hypothetical protein
VRIPCDNDGDTAQGATSRAIAHLMAVVLVDHVLPGESHAAISKWLRESAHGRYPSLFIRPEVRNRLRDDQVTHSKIGRGPLKKGDLVFSEVALLTDVGKRLYIASFLNVDYNPYAIDQVLEVIKHAIRIYEAP